MTRLRGSPATPRQAISLGCLCAVFGGVIAGFGLYLGLQTLVFITQAQPASGVVIRLAQSGKVFKPVIAFTTASGQPVVFTDTQGTNPPAHKVDDRVEVLYLPDHPNQVKENSFLDLWLFPVLPFGFGAFWLLSGVAMIFNGINRLRK